MCVYYLSTNSHLLSSVLVVFRPGESGITDLAIDSKLASDLLGPWNFDFQLFRRCLVNGMGVCHVAGQTLPARLRRSYGRKVNDSDFQIFHINRLVWYLVLTHTTRERVDVSEIDADQRVQRPVCNCHDKTYTAEEKDAEDV